MSITVVMILSVLFLLGGLFYLGKKHQRPGEQLGISVLRIIKNDSHTALLIITMGVLLSQALLAGSIHPANELHISSEGRMLQHLVISFLGFLMTVFFIDAVEEVATGKSKQMGKSTFNVSVRIILSATLSLLIPLGNLFLIAKGLGDHNTLLDWFTKLTSSPGEWARYVQYYKLPHNYDPASDISYTVFGALMAEVAALITTFLEFMSVTNIKDDKKGKDKSTDGKGAADSAGSKNDEKKGDESSTKGNVYSDDDLNNSSSLKAATLLAKDDASIKPLAQLLHTIFLGLNVEKVLDASLFVLMQARLRTKLTAAAGAETAKLKELLGVYTNRVPDATELAAIQSPTSKIGYAGKYSTIKNLIKSEVTNGFTPAK